MRFLNLCVLGVAGAGRRLCLRDQVRVDLARRARRQDARRRQRERDAIAALRAEWATLENPARIQGLARRHLRLRPADAAQYDSLDRLPERPPSIVQPPPADAIADKIENDG